MNAIGKTRIFTYISVAAPVSMSGFDGLSHVPTACTSHLWSCQSKSHRDTRILVFVFPVKRA